MVNGLSNRGLLDLATNLGGFLSLRGSNNDSSEFLIKRNEVGNMITSHQKLGTEALN